MRDEHLVAMRPQINTAAGALPLETFQNDILRPVIKLQHDVFLQAWHRYAQQHKGRFYKLNKPEQEAYLRHAYQTNRAFRALNLGIVCGVLTKVEWAAFRQNEKELAKRIYTLIAERVRSTSEAYIKEA